MSHFSEAVRQRLTQGLSLSERAIRALSAVAGGASTLLTEALLPKALRETTTYKVTFGLMQQYIIEEVAGMEKEITEGQIELDEDYVRRKMVGTALEAGGLLFVRFSPLWVFAIAGDAAAGSKVYLHRLVEQLKQNNVIAEETEVKELLDLFAALQHAANQSATVIDMPPLSRKELATMADDMKAGYSRVFGLTADLMPQFDDIWEGMEQLTRRESISLEQLEGLMTVDAVSWSEKSTGIVLSVGQAGSMLFDEHILDSYRITLAAASEQGVDRYVRDHMQPFLQAARSHFDPDRTTWVEKKLEGTSTDSE